ncbi:hypothetical protein HWA77_16815 [Photobacterium damselae subsp. damselae]|uniref:Uncharacterized protein n=1 Tax=Photobacterium damselae subsp. damselae TaxID=85581 RepID=A0A850QZV3_PHODD|nr:hypothetical protein [Photobacterium damselae subsp. damselae]
MFRFIASVFDDLFEGVHPLIITIILSGFLCFYLYFTQPEQIGPSTTVTLPCNNLSGCKFSGVLTKNGDTYTLTQNDNSVITFNKFLNISKPIKED